jgi:hypothetical protein
VPRRPPATLYGFAKGARYNPKPLFSLGAPMTGARFTPKGGAPALYLAENQVTALAEVVQVGGHVPLTPTLQPSALVVYPVEVKIQRVLDVTRLGTNSRSESMWSPRHSIAGGGPPTSSNPASSALRASIQSASTSAFSFKVRAVSAGKPASEPLASPAASRLSPQSTVNR